MAVKFLMSHTVGALYSKDEVAGFDEKVEKDLIERKIAGAYKKPGKTEDGKAGGQAAGTGTAGAAQA